MNDHKLTKQRMQEQSNGIPKGLPVFVVCNMKWNIVKLFANKSNAEWYKSELEKIYPGDDISLTLEFMEDIKTLSYQLEVK